MPSASRFILKDSHPAMRSLVPPPKRDSSTAASSSSSSHFVRGRRYCPHIAKNHPRGVALEDIILGLEFACLSITDDQPDTLRQIAKTNPWQERAIQKIVQEEEEMKTTADGSMEPPQSLVHAKLSEILEAKYGLMLDCFINESGMTRGGHILDTQGYIAHNDSVIVLSYRCTTSVSDWVTNFSATTSAWELDEDVARGFSGYFSACDDRPGCCSCFCGSGTAVEDLFDKNNEEDDKDAIQDNKNDKVSGHSQPKTKPRVHTGFYNNFLVTVPYIRRYIDPLLQSTSSPPRTLYVAGHSLGGGIATMAGAYFLLHAQDDATATPAYDWHRHRLRVVTAGSPRAFDANMCDLVDQRLQELAATKDSKSQSQMGGASFIRIVRDKDVVPTVPPEFLGFRHATGSAFVFLPKSNDGKGKKKEKCYAPSHLHPRNFVLIDPCLDKSHIVPKHTMKKLIQQYPDLLDYYEEPDAAKKRFICNSQNTNNIDNPYMFEAIEISSEQCNDTIDNANSSLAKTCTTSIAFQRDDDEDSDNDDDEKKEIVGFPQAPRNVSSNPNSNAASSDTITASPSQYDKYIKLLPRRLRDHCPDFYLEPLHALRGQLREEQADV